MSILYNEQEAKAAIARGAAMIQCACLAALQSSTDHDCWINGREIETWPGIMAAMLDRIKTLEAKATPTRLR